MDHITRWHIKVDVFEHEESTVAHLVLDTGTRALSAHGRETRVASEPFVPEIAAEFAVGSALVDLGTQLLVIASADTTTLAEQLARR